MTSTVPPTATRGTPYSFQLTASGLAVTPVWKKSGPLPRGLKLSLAGVISGTPSTKIAAGPYGVKVSLTEVTPVGKVKVVASLTLTLQ